VTVDAGKFTDAALNANEAATPDTVTIDTKNPTVTIYIVDTDLSNTANSSNVSYTFTKPPIGSTLADITPTTGTVTGLVMDDATHYHPDFPAFPTRRSSDLVTVDAGKFTDAALNANEAATPDTVTIDTKNPTVTISDDEPDTANIAGGGIL